MAFLQGKTPISFLQELCTKRGITPQYDLIANEGAVHEPIFVFRVTAGDVVGTGKGTSKRKAKHNAALSMLTQMMGLPASSPAINDYSQLAKSSAGGDSNHLPEAGAGNPVGELQELTQKKLWPPPIYEFAPEQGPPHAREFVCTITLWNLRSQGVGKSKKLSKRDAALKMLRQVKDGMMVTQPKGEPLDDNDEESMPLPHGDVKSPYMSIKDGCKVAPLNPQASHQISQFYQKLKTKGGKKLVALQSLPLCSPATNCCQTLQEIAEEQTFEVTYVDIQEMSMAGQYQCLVQLSALPVAVCHGTGTTKDEAHAHAAHNALQYLKIMTKKV
ncbi:RISC-loading complex subunit tarbp2 [Lamellibrachia satsuma]|nr:RISC-loading complex subunit tarbp2 [Lamellibrachia satsuma]